MDKVVKNKLFKHWNSTILRGEFSPTVTDIDAFHLTEQVFHGKGSRSKTMNHDRLPSPPVETGLAWQKTCQTQFIS